MGVTDVLLHFFFFFLSLFIYFERESLSRGGAERERERESQAGSALTEQGLMRHSDPWAVKSWSELKPRVWHLTESLRHPFLHFLYIFPCSTNEQLFSNPYYHYRVPFYDWSDFILVHNFIEVSVVFFICRDCLCICSLLFFGHCKSLFSKCFYATLRWI